MAFTSISFFIFLFITWTAYYLTPVKLRWLTFLIAGSCFYFLADASMTAVPFVLSAITYFAGIWMEKQVSTRKTNLIFIASLILIVGSLISFKYIPFFENLLAELIPSDTGNNINKSPFFQIAVPLGISYLTFQSIGYLIEIKRKNQPAETNFGQLTGFLLFFPKVISGPVERAHHLLPQLKSPQPLRFENITQGCKRILWGLFKKLVIADRLGIYVGSILENVSNHSGISIFTACVFYLFQMYADFSGYTDMAVGTSRLFGFRIMENFNRPLFAKSMTEFWRKWHMSLSTWFADYFYTPIAINRRDWGSGAIVYASIFTFVTLGFWHGANYTFLVFGLLHGLMLSAEFLTKKQRKKIRSKLPEYINAAGGNLFTVMYFGFSLIFFRAATVGDAFQIIRGIIQNPGVLFTADKTEFTFSLMGIFFLIAAESKQEYFNQAFSLSANRRWQLQSLYYCFLILLILLMGVFDGGQFIYRQF